jgi:hypothetical protein
MEGSDPKVRAALAHAVSRLSESLWLLLAPGDAAVSLPRCASWLPLVAAWCSRRG